ELGLQLAQNGELRAGRGQGTGVLRRLLLQPQRVELLAPRVDQAGQGVALGPEFLPRGGRTGEDLRPVDLVQRLELGPDLVAGGGTDPQYERLAASLESHAGSGRATELRAADSREGRFLPRTFRPDQAGKLPT